MNNLFTEFEDLINSIENQKTIVEVVQSGQVYKIKLVNGLRSNFTDRLYLTMFDAVNAAYKLTHELKRG